MRIQTIIHKSGYLSGRCGNTLAGVDIDETVWTTAELVFSGFGYDDVIKAFARIITPF